MLISCAVACRSPPILIIPTPACQPTITGLTFSLFGYSAGYTNSLYFHRLAGLYKLLVYRTIRSISCLLLLNYLSTTSSGLCYGSEVTVG